MDNVLRWAHEQPSKRVQQCVPSPTLPEFEVSQPHEPPRAKRDQRRAREEQNASEGRVAAATAAAWDGRPLEALADLAESATLVPAAELARAEAALARVERPVQVGRTFLDLLMNPFVYVIFGTSLVVYIGNALSKVTAGGPNVVMHYAQKGVWWTRHLGYGLITGL